MKLLKEDIKEELLSRYMEILSLCPSDELEAHFEAVMSRLSEEERKETRALLRSLSKWKGVGPLSAKEMLLRIGQLWVVSEDEIWRKFKARTMEIPFQNRKKSP